MNNWLLCISYLLYILFWETLIIGGTGYAVFVLGYSGWWFLLAYTLSVSAYPPKKWAKLLQKKKGEHDYATRDCER